MISALLLALILCAVVGVVAWGITKVVPLPPTIAVVIQVIAAVICLLILYNAIVGHLP